MNRGPTLLQYSVDLRIQTYTEPVPLNMENSPQNIRGDIRIFLRCTRRVTSGHSLYATVVE